MADDLTRLAGDSFDAEPTLAGAQDRRIGHSAGVLTSLAATEDLLAASWERVLKRSAIDRDEDCRNLRMNSNRAFKIIHDFRAATSIELPINSFLETPSIRQMAAALFEGRALRAAPLVRLRPGLEDEPLFLLGGGGGVLLEFTELVRRLDFPGVVYGLPPAGLDGTGALTETFQAEARRAVDIIETVQRKGPYRVAGYSVGGMAALEIARLLLASGKGPVFVGLMDPQQADHSWPFPVWLAFMARKLVGRLTERGKRKPDRGQGALVPEETALFPPRRGSQFVFRFRDPRHPDYPFYAPHYLNHYPGYYHRVGTNVLRMKGLYTPTIFDAPVCFFASEGGDPSVCDPSLVWPKYLPQAEWVRIPGNHVSMLQGKHAARLAAEMSSRMKNFTPVR